MRCLAFRLVTIFYILKLVICIPSHQVWYWCINIQIRANFLHGYLKQIWRRFGKFEETNITKETAKVRQCCCSANVNLLSKCATVDDLPLNCIWPLLTLPTLVDLFLDVTPPMVRSCLAQLLNRWGVNWWCDFSPQPSSPSSPARERGARQCDQ